MDEKKPKRKTTTSWQVKAKYNAKHYKRIVADIDANLVTQWSEKLKQENISKSSFIKQAIMTYLQNNQ